MEIIIKIPKEEYNYILKSDNSVFADCASKECMMHAIKKGTPLPKGHGRLKDIDWIDDNCPDYRTEDGAWCYKWEDIDNAPTIIEADETGSEVV